MRNFLTLLTCLILASCGPKYKIMTNFTAPTDSQGKICVQKALDQKGFCDSACMNQFHTCTKKAQKIGQTNYDSAVIKYNKEMIEYKAKLEIYNRQEPLRKITRTYETECKKHHKFCKEYEENLLLINTLESHPSQPHTPRLNEYVAHASSSCTKQCGCHAQYEIAFQACGGQVTKSRICIERCEEQ